MCNFVLFLKFDWFLEIIRGPPQGVRGNQEHARTYVTALCSDCFRKNIFEHWFMFPSTDSYYYCRLLFLMSHVQQQVLKNKRREKVAGWFLWIHLVTWRFMLFLSLSHHSSSSSSSSSLSLISFPRVSYLISSPPAPASCHLSVSHHLVQLSSRSARLSARLPEPDSLKTHGTKRFKTPWVGSFWRDFFIFFESSLWAFVTVVF